MPYRLLAKKCVGTIRLDTSSTNITTGAWATVSAALPGACAAFEIFAGGGSVIKLAVGSAGNEVELPYTVLPGGSGLCVPIEIPNGVRLSARAVDADMTSGYLVINLFG